jgi:nitrate/nitrite transporter NarK
MTLPAMLMIFSILNPISPILQKKFNPKIVQFVGVAVMLLSGQLAINQKTWNSFFYIFVFGLSIGGAICCYIPIISGWEWFPEKRGLVTGVIMSG